MQQADVMENQYQVPRYRSTCNYTAVLFLTTFLCINMSDRSDQGLPQGVDGHSPSGTDNLRSGSFTSPVAVNTGPSDPVTPEVMGALAHLYSNQSKATSQALYKPWIMMSYVA